MSKKAESTGSSPQQATPRLWRALVNLMLLNNQQVEAGWEGTLAHLDESRLRLLVERGAIEEVKV